MKQKITVDKLNEMPEELRRKLGKWAFTKEGINWYDRGGQYPLLTIGQMIEFLDTKDYFIGGHVSGTEGQIWHDDRGWALCYLGSDSLMGFTQEKLTGQHEELCDALWEAIKEVLSKEDNANTL